MVIGLMYGIKSHGLLAIGAVALRKIGCSKLPTWPMESGMIPLGARVRLLTGLTNWYKWEVQN